MGYKVPTEREIVWRIFSKHADRFQSAWKLLELQGKCDGIGGCQWERIIMEFVRAGFPAEVSTFIVERANEPSPG